MSYLIFIVAVGLFALLGAGGPLHGDRWFHVLSRRVDAIELDLWPSLVLRVGAPLLAGVTVLWVLEAFLGGLAEALVGTALLYFSLGRGDYPTELQRFLARARVGDEEGAAMLLSESSADREPGEARGQRALRDFAYRGFARWFPPVLYFWLLGPFGAAAYRLVVLANAESEGRFDAAQRLLDWLPSRLLLLTFCVLGDFERSKGLLAREVLDTEVTAETLLARGVTRAWRLDDQELDEPQGVVTAVETAQKAMNRATGFWVVVASVLALL